MAEDIAISVNDVSKMYKLYDNPMDRLKESLGLSRKKKYKEHYALNHVSFQVHKGETVGIIGTNGSGKSTILKIITGVLSPTAGECISQRKHDRFFQGRDRCQAAVYSGFCRYR